VLAVTEDGTPDTIELLAADRTPPEAVRQP
jgi:hypothetical protein